MLASAALADYAGAVDITEAGVTGTEIGRNVIYGIVASQNDVCVKPEDNIIYVDCQKRGKRT